MNRLHSSHQALIVLQNLASTLPQVRWPQTLRLQRHSDHQAFSTLQNPAFSSQGPDTQAMWQYSSAALRTSGSLGISRMHRPPLPMAFLQDLRSPGTPFHAPAPSQNHARTRKRPDTPSFNPTPLAPIAPRPQASGHSGLQAPRPLLRSLPQAVWHSGIQATAPAKTAPGPASGQGLRPSGPRPLVRSRPQAA
jgi:hypothetical protein